MLVYAGREDNISLEVIMESLMKKTTKKLTLAKETLRNLGSRNLELVGGGYLPTDTCSGCDPIPTESHWCPREPITSIIINF
jgi:hypothetical protein